MVIAVDGTTASGKGTVARLLAEKLDISYLDTGAIYRAIAVSFIYGGFSLDGFDKGEFERRLKNTDIKLKCGADKRMLVYLNGQDITGVIRDNNVSTTVPILAQLDFVQDKVHKTQTQYAGENSLVVEGRETTSVAFPDADYKFYFDADINIRAKRRQNDLSKKGEIVPFEEVLKQIRERDRLDFERELSPLIKVPDAIEIDGTEMTPAEMLDKMLEYIVK
jgi:cytidylate kinase